LATSAKSSSIAAEVLFEDLEPGTRLRRGKVELLFEVTADRADEREAGYQSGDPESEDGLAVVVAPGAESTEHERDSRGSWNVDTNSTAKDPSNGMNARERCRPSRAGLSPTTPAVAERRRGPDRRAAVQRTPQRNDLPRDDDTHVSPADHDQWPNQRTAVPRPCHAELEQTP
jgi:hypothetical protein